ncbi:hypothetical protein H2248_007047 [Termitomyces sp. 'cryptogamus']|nr:hypothetical protein H2248_007047 [Termitomyces sp. 'cryptogamus']
MITTVSSASDANSAYEAIDRLAKSKAGKSAASLIPPLDPVSFTLDVPIIQENDQLLPSPPTELVKAFKHSCSRVREEFHSLEMELYDFTAVLDEMTKNTYVWSLCTNLR